jgi:hypothetical protein
MFRSDYNCRNHFLFTVGDFKDGKITGKLDENEGICITHTHPDNVATTAPEQRDETLRRVNSCLKFFKSISEEVLNVYSDKDRASIMTALNSAVAEDQTRLETLKNK